MDKAIVDIAKFFKESVGKIGVCFDQLLDVVLQHEKRLQELEKPPNISKQLGAIKVYIENIEDEGKKTAALAEFTALCNVLGLTDLEA